MRTYDLLRKSVRQGAYAPCTPIQNSPMAIYHASTKHVTRSAGRSAVAAAAYRGGCALTDERTGLVHDYTRKGGVVSSELVLPDGQAADRGQLWSAAELAEKRKDARTAREWVVALPAELDKDERAELARSFAEGLAQRYGVAVDLAVHEPSRHGSDKNHHAHLLTTTRKVSRLESGGVVLGEKAHIEQSDKARRAAGLGSGADEVKAVREMWEGMANAALARAGQEARIDARSLKDQGIDREATVHLGPKANEMEQRGAGSDRGDQNRTVLANNQERAELVTQLAALRAEQAREAQARRERLLQALAAEQARRDEAARQEAEALKAAQIAQAKQAAIQAEQAAKEAALKQLSQEHTAYLKLRQQETSRVSKQVERVHKKASDRYDRRCQKERAVDALEPQMPKGMFASIKRPGYERAHDKWSGLKKAAENLSNQARWFRNRCGRIIEENKIGKMVSDRLEKKYPELAKKFDVFEKILEAQRQEKRRRDADEAIKKREQERAERLAKGNGKGWGR